MTEPFIDPELARQAKFLPRSVGRPTVVRMSRVMERVLDWRRTPVGGEIVDLGPFIVRVHRPAAPAATPRPALLWIHGGGFVIGHAAQEDRTAQLFADRLGAIVASVDYRLSPKHQFPAAVHDCHDALVWLAGRSDVDAARVAIGGASAGGGLAAQLALLARSRGAVDPVFQLLVYPMLDDRTCTRTDIDERGFRVWNNASNRYGWRAYLGFEPGGDHVSPMAAPARHDDLAGLPAAWIGVGDQDLFHDEDVAFATRLREAGVPCALDVIPGAFHGFDAIAATSTIATTFRESQLAALRAAFDPAAVRAGSS